MLVLSSPRGEKTTYSKADTDFIMGINFESGDFAIIPIEEITASGIVKISEQCRRRDYFNSFMALVDKEDKEN